MRIRTLSILFLFLILNIDGLESKKKMKLENKDDIVYNFNKVELKKNCMHENFNYW